MEVEGSSSRPSSTSRDTAMCKNNYMTCFPTAVVVECCEDLCSRVHITESTLDHLHGEFDTEPAYGDRRNASLCNQQISTYFIVFQHPRKV